ncbi:MAG: SCO family protein, partial [Alphaproteobacteria bacterium]|nr:SCO family protein [Alphaproteobacteria bacterium]
MSVALVGAVIVQRYGHVPIVSGTALVGGPFTLTNQDGKTVTEKDFLGTYMLIFFGYTYCPDICPTELQVMTQALTSMGDKASAIRPLFITVDPERDTPDV